MHVKWKRPHLRALCSRGSFKVIVLCLICTSDETKNVLLPEKYVVCPPTREHRGGVDIFLPILFSCNLCRELVVDFSSKISSDGGVCTYIGWHSYDPWNFLGFPGLLVGYLKAWFLEKETAKIKGVLLHSMVSIDWNNTDLAGSFVQSDLKMFSTHIRSNLGSVLMDKDRRSPGSNYD